MFKHLVEEDQFLEITGFRDVEVANVDQLLKALHSNYQADAVVQFFNADLIATWEHLYYAVLDALMAFRTKRNISKNLAIEIMLYASAQRQIKKAINIVGVKKGCSNIAVVILSKSEVAIKLAITSILNHLREKQNEQVLSLSCSKNQSIRDAFGITETELSIFGKQNDIQHALVELVIERMALLSTRL